MTPSLHIIRPGLLTTVQDLGRAGYQSLGIAVGGALDPVGLRAANALVGNAPGAGTLEVLYLGPTVAIDADDVLMSFAGASAAIEILPDATAARGRRVETMRSIRLHRGEIVRIGSLSEGAVLYVAVEGGFDIEPVLAFRPMSAAASAAGRVARWRRATTCPCA
jgi:allophanate hydrolase subunit 2